MRNHILFYLNGERHEVLGEHAGQMLADYLRSTRQLTGTKIVCAEGDCGACTVLRYFPHPSLKGKAVPREFLPMNSCIATVAQMDGSSLLTVDALANQNGLTPVQQAMVQCHGSQCGFCTPGIVMALTGMVEHRLEKQDFSPLTRQEAKNALTGNLCRCTGYEPILDAAISVDLESCASVKKRFWSPKIERELRAAAREGVQLQTDRFVFHAPRTLREASRLLQKRRSARIPAAGTDLGVVHNKRKIRLEDLISLHLIPELYDIRVLRKGRLLVGARATLSELRLATKEAIPELARFLDLFASPQIKNVATLAGNLCNASPIADTPPSLLALDAVIHTYGPSGKREIPVERFYLGYRKTALKRGEFVTGIELSEPSPLDAFRIYKVSQRKDLDISTVNAAFRIRWNPKRPGEIQEVRLALGGIAATPVRMKRTEKLLTRSTLDFQVMGEAAKTLQNEMQPISDLRGSAAFRRVAAENLLHRFFREVSQA